MICSTSSTTSSSGGSHQQQSQSPSFQDALAFIRSVSAAGSGGLRSQSRCIQCMDSITVLWLSHVTRFQTPYDVLKLAMGVVQRSLIELPQTSTSSVRGSASSLSSSSSSLPSSSSSAAAALTAATTLQATLEFAVYVEKLLRVLFTTTTTRCGEQQQQQQQTTAVVILPLLSSFHRAVVMMYMKQLEFKGIATHRFVGWEHIVHRLKLWGDTVSAAAAASAGGGGAATGTAAHADIIHVYCVAMSSVFHWVDDAAASDCLDGAPQCLLSLARAFEEIISCNLNHGSLAPVNPPIVQHVLSLATKMLNKIAERCLVTPSLRMQDHDKWLLETVLPSASRPSRCVSSSSRLSYGDAAAWVAATMRLDVQRTNSDRRGFCDPLTLNPEASDRDVLAAVDKCLAAKDHHAVEEEEAGGGASRVNTLRDRLFVSTALCLCKCLHHWDALPVPTTTTQPQLITTKAPPSVSASSSSTTTVVGLWDLLVFAATAKFTATNVNATTDENMLPDEILSFLQGVAVRYHAKLLEAEMLASRAYLHVTAAAASSSSSAVGVSGLKRLLPLLSQHEEEGEQEEEIIDITQRQQQSTVTFLHKVIRCVADGVNPRHALFRWYLWEVAQSSSSSSSSIPSSSSTSPSSAARRAPLRFQEAAAVGWQCPTSFVIALAFADVGSASWFLDMALPAVHYFCSYSRWVGLGASSSSSSRCDGDSSGANLHRSPSLATAVSSRLSATSNPLLVASLCRVSQEVVGGLCLEGDLPAARSLAFVPLSLSVYSVLASRWAAPWEGVLTLFAVCRSDTPPLYPPPTTTPPVIEGGGVEEEHPQRALVLLSLEHLRLWLTSRIQGGRGRANEGDHIVLRVKSLRSLIALSLDATHSTAGNNDDDDDSMRRLESRTSSLDALLWAQEPESETAVHQPIQAEDYVPYRMTRHEELGRTFATRQRCMQSLCHHHHHQHYRNQNESVHEGNAKSVHASAVLLLHQHHQSRGKGKQSTVVSGSSNDEGVPAEDLPCMATLQATVTHQLPLWMCCYPGREGEEQQRSSSSSSISEPPTTTFTVTTTASRVPQHVVANMCEEMQRIFLSNRMSLSGATAAAYEQASSASRETKRAFKETWWATRRDLEARVGRVVESMETDPRDNISSSALVPQHTLQWLWLPFPGSVRYDYGNDEAADRRLVSLETCLAAAGTWLWSELLLISSSSTLNTTARAHALSETWTYHHCLCLANWAAWRFLECGASRGDETTVAEECGDVLIEAVPSCVCCGGRDGVAEESMGPLRSASSQVVMVDLTHDDDVDDDSELMDQKSLNLQPQRLRRVVCQFVHRLVDSLVTHQIPQRQQGITSSGSGWNRLLYLAMSNELHVLPWEGLSMMREGVSLVRCPLPATTTSRRAAVPQPSSSQETSDHLAVHYVLNPTGDLKETQKRFEESFSKLSASSSTASSSSSSSSSAAGAKRLMTRWSGIVGPSQAAHWHYTNLFHYRQHNNKSSNEENPCDVFLYIGHGGGECLVPREVLYDMLPPLSAYPDNAPPPRSHPRFALLMGCCSALLVNSPEHFDPVGMPYAWLHAGAEAVVGCTMHVSDGDIDRLTTALLESFLRISLTGKSSALVLRRCSAVAAEDGLQRCVPSQPSSSRGSSREASLEPQPLDEREDDPPNHQTQHAVPRNQEDRQDSFSQITSIDDATRPAATATLTCAVLAHSLRLARCVCKLPLLTGCMTVCYSHMPQPAE